MARPYAALRRRRRRNFRQALAVGARFVAPDAGLVGLRRLVISPIATLASPVWTAAVASSSCI
jgi:hypothetical protein